MLLIQHPVCMGCISLMLMTIQCEMVKVRGAMYIVHQIIEDSDEV